MLVKKIRKFLNNVPSAVIFKILDIVVPAICVGYSVFDFVRSFIKTETEYQCCADDSNVEE